VGTRKSIPATEIDQALHRLAEAIIQRHAAAENLVFLGIANGGVELCRRLSLLVAANRGTTPAAGVLDVSFHRDDLGVNPIPKVAQATRLPPSGVDSAAVILVDDVLFSGRTVRAAMEELFSHGRPTRIELAVLVDRGNHRLPISADYVGFEEKTTPAERVSVALDGTDASRDLITISAAP